MSEEETRPKGKIFKSNCCNEISPDYPNSNACIKCNEHSEFTEIKGLDGIRCGRCHTIWSNIIEIPGETKLTSSSTCSRCGSPDFYKLDVKLATLAELIKIYEGNKKHAESIIKLVEKREKDSPPEATDE